MESTLSPSFLQQEMSEQASSIHRFSCKEKEKSLKKLSTVRSFGGSPYLSNSKYL
jgi:hypothetical protein